MEDSRDRSAEGLHICQLSKRFGRLTAIDNVSFTVRRGEVLGIIGPNGAGKTTLLECLAGVLSADAGSVESGGQPLDAAGRVRSLFYLPDAITPWPAQTVSWALRFAVGFLGGRSNDVHDVMRDLDLWPLVDQRIGTLSKGQRKRAVLAVGLLAPQGILISDEPFDGLDLRQTRAVGAALRRRAAAGRSSSTRSTASSGSSTRSARSPGPGATAPRRTRISSPPTIRSCSLLSREKSGCGRRATASVISRITSSRQQS